MMNTNLLGVRIREAKPVVLATTTRRRIAVLL